MEISFILRASGISDGVWVRLSHARDCHILEIHALDTLVFEPEPTAPAFTFSHW